MMEHEIYEINNSIDSVIGGVHSFLKKLDASGINGKDKFYYSKVLLHHIIPIFTNYFDKCRKV